MNEAQANYNLVFAGFIPTIMISDNKNTTLVHINELFYSGGLQSFLENCIKKVTGNSINLENQYNNKHLNSTYTEKENTNDYAESEFASLANKYYSLANFDYQKLHYDNAIAYYNKALKLNPFFAEAYFWRGIAFQNQGKHREAIVDFDEVIKINPHDFKAYDSRGLSRFYLQDKSGAVNDFSIASNMINKIVASIYYNRGFARHEIGEIWEAIKDYTESIKMNPNYYLAYLNRGDARSKIGYHKGAIEDYTIAISINPNLDIIFAKRGTARYYLGDKKGAVEDYTQAININPKDFISYLNRSVARYELGDKQGAIKDYDYAFNMDSELAKSNQVRQIGEVILSDDSRRMITNSYQEHETCLEELSYADDDERDNDFYTNYVWSTDLDEYF